MGSEDTGIAELLGEKGTLSALFAMSGALLSDAEISVARNAIINRFEKEIQSKEVERKRDQQKQEKPNSEKTQEMAMHTMLTDIARAIEANNDRLRVLERQQEALGKHLALLLAGEPVE